MSEMMRIRIILAAKPGLPEAAANELAEWAEEQSKLRMNVRTPIITEGLLVYWKPEALR